MIENYILDSVVDQEEFESVEERDLESLQQEGIDEDETE